MNDGWGHSFDALAKKWNLSWYSSGSDSIPYSRV